MAKTYDAFYDEEYKKILGNSVNKLEEAQQQNEKSLKTNYDTTVNKLQQTRDNSLKEAYISRMKEQKAAPATLARQGLNGGYSETNQAAITRNYQNNRNSAEQNYQNNLKDADVAYNSDLSSLKATYADAINSAKQNAISLALSSAAQRFNAQNVGVGGSSGTNPDENPGTDPAVKNTGTVSGTSSALKQMQSGNEAPVAYYTTVMENGVLYRLGKNANGRTITKEAVKSGGGAQSQAYK